MQYEAFFDLAVPKRKDGSTVEQYLCTMNQRAMRTIREVTGQEPLPYLIGEPGDLDRTQLLAYACTETFRRGNGYKLTFDEFIDGPYLGVYGSSYWANLAAFIEDTVVQTFPWVAELRSLIRDQATKSGTKNGSESPSTGTTVSTSPSNSKSSRRKKSSGTSGTTPT